MTRRMILCAGLAVPLRADAAQEVWDVLTAMVAALGQGNAVAFLAAVSPAMAGYDKLRTAVIALVSQAEVQCSIDLIRNEGDERTRIVEGAWLLHIAGRVDTRRVTRRRERVACRFEKSGRKWLLSALEPLSIFNPPRV